MKLRLITVLIISLVCVLMIKIIVRQIHSRSMTLNIPESLLVLQENEKLAHDVVDYLIRSKYWHVRECRNGLDCSLRKEYYRDIDNSKNTFTAKVFDFVPSFEKIKTNVTIQKLGETIPASILCKYNDQENHGMWLSSTIMLQITPSFYLRICEGGYTRDRPYTMAFLDYFSEIVSHVYNGTSESFLQEEGSIRFSTNRVDNISIRNDASGVLAGTISGWVNIGRKGKMEACFYDSHTGAYLSKHRLQQMSEYVGWSDNITNQFFFSFPMCIDGDGEMHEMKMILQFSPDFEMPLEVFSTNVLIRTWVR